MLDLARNVLRFPPVYRLFQRCVGDGGRRYLDLHVRPRSGERVLDIGCGTADILHLLPDVEYLGIDLSEKYIRAAQRRFGNRARFVCQSVSQAAVDAPGSFDVAMANGVLHHLNDAEALSLLRLARLALKRTGRLVTFDGCWVPNQSSIARLLLCCDRGRHVRACEDYVGLASQVFADVRSTIRHDLLKLPYTHVVMECSGVNPACQFPEFPPQSHLADNALRT